VLDRVLQCPLPAGKQRYDKQQSTDHGKQRQAHRAHKPFAVSSTVSRR
jgi:hypothetical protein